MEVLMRYTVAALTYGLLIVVAGLCLSCSNNPVKQNDTEASLSAIDLENQKLVSVSEDQPAARGIRIIKLQGKVRSFGWNLLANPPQPKPLIGEPGVAVWFAEYPFTKNLGITTDSNGYWTVYIIKPRAVTVSLSFVYEKDFYPAPIEQMVFPNGLPEGWQAISIKSNVHEIASANITDLAAQMPDELFLFYSKTRLEGSISALIGKPYQINNILVSTVGKSWASIYDPRLPHGDSGAVVSANPAPQSPVQGPIYFDETVTPNPVQRVTSKDGGVLFNNIPAGKCSMTAQKSPYIYAPIIFQIDPAFKLYIISASFNSRQ